MLVPTPKRLQLEALTVMGDMLYGTTVDEQLVFCTVQAAVAGTAHAAVGNVSAAVWEPVRTAAAEAIAVDVVALASHGDLR
eukprot:SAG11_NODE_1904_length_4088_cov_3.427676_8_plen_81_part_00